jgi:hypothetical protein
VKILESTNKYIAPLLKNPSSDKLTEFAFRTHYEVESFLAKFGLLVSSACKTLSNVETAGTQSWIVPTLPVDGIKINPVTGVDKDKLQRFTEALENLHNQMQTLKTLQALIESTFPKHANTLMPTLNETLVEVETALEKTFTKISGIAKSIQPSQFSKLTKTLTKSVLSGLQGLYDGAFPRLLLTHTDQGPVFTHLIEFVNLTQPSAEYTYPKFYVVLEGKVFGNRMKVRCYTTHDFVLPSEALTQGQEVQDEESMLKAMDKILEEDQFYHSTILPFPLNLRQLRPLLSNIHGIKDVVIDKMRSRLLVHFDLSQDPNAYGNKIASNIQSVFRKGIVRWKRLSGTRTLEFQVATKEPNK